MKIGTVRRRRKRRHRVDTTHIFENREGHASASKMKKLDSISRHEYIFKNLTRSISHSIYQFVRIIFPRWKKQRDILAFAAILLPRRSTIFIFLTYHDAQTRKFLRDYYATLCSATLFSRDINWYLLIDAYPACVYRGYRFAALASSFVCV